MFMFDELNIEVFHEGMLATRVIMVGNSYLVYVDDKPRLALHKVNGCWEELTEPIPKEFLDKVTHSLEQQLSGQ